MKDKLKLLRKYLWNIIIWVDQGCNVIFLGGSPDHTVSGRVGYYALVGKRWAIILEKIIDTIFFWQHKHCYNSIEWYVIERDGIYKESHKITIPK